MHPAKQSAIAFILKGYPRLSETFITNEILLLEQLGYDIHIMALRNPGEQKVHENVSRIKAPVTYIPDYFWPHFSAFVGSSLKLFLKSPKRFWPAFKYALLRSIRQRSSSTIKRFAQAAILVQNHYDGSNLCYFHAHFSHGPTTVAYFAAELTGLKYSFSAHAKDIYLQEREMLLRKIYNAQFAVTCTGFNVKHLLGVAGEDAPVFGVYHGIDISLFHPDKKQKKAADAKPVILSIGRFVPKKGFPTLIRALARVKENGQEFHCHLVGGGPMQEELETLIRELGLQNDVTLSGKKSQTELLEYFCEADIFALACEVQADGDRDGIPNVLVEAMAMELPSVSTNISGIPELLKNDENGLLVEERSPEQFSEALLKLLQDKPHAAKLGKAARKEVERAFDNKRNVKRIGELLDAAMAGNLDAKRTSREGFETPSTLDKTDQMEEKLKAA